MGIQLGSLCCKVIQRGWRSCRGARFWEVVATRTSAGHTVGVDTGYSCTACLQLRLWHGTWILYIHLPPESAVRTVLVLDLSYTQGQLTRVLLLRGRVLFFDVIYQSKHKVYIIAQHMMSFISRYRTSLYIQAVIWLYPFSCFRLSIETTGACILFNLLIQVWLLKQPRGFQLQLGQASKMPTLNTYLCKNVWILIFPALD